MIEAARKRRNASNKEGGAALVETAIILIPLCLIIFGIIEYGFIFKDSLTISNATRAGARTASAEPGATTFYSDTVDAVTRGGAALNFDGRERLFIYKAKADGLPESGSAASCTSNCSEYRWNAGAKKFQLVKENWSIDDHAACFGAADSVGVILESKHDALSGFFKGMTLRERTVMRFEPTTSDC